MALHKPKTKCGSQAGAAGQGSLEGTARTSAGLLVFLQLVTTRAGTQGPCAGVAAAVRAAAIASLTAVHDLHLDPCGGIDTVQHALTSPWGPTPRAAQPKPTLGSLGATLVSLAPPVRCLLTVALPAIGTQLIACAAHTFKGSLSVEAAVSTLGQPHGTFVHI